MEYICNKCHHRTWVYSPEKKKQIVKNKKRWNQCPKCGAYNNKKIQKKWIEKNPKRVNIGCFQDEKRIEY